MAPRLYTQEQLEEVFRGRMRDQEDLIGKVAERAVEKIRPEFVGVNKRIDELTDQVKKTNGQVSKHSELFEDLGVVDVSQEERQALPEVLVDHVRTKEDRHKHDGVERRRVVRQQLIAQFIGTAAAVVVAMLGLVGLLKAAGILH